MIGTVLHVAYGSDGGRTEVRSSGKSFLLIYINKDNEPVDTTLVKQTTLEQAIKIAEQDQKDF